MVRVARAIAVFWLGLLPLSVPGSPSGGSTLVRSFSQREVLTNASIRVTATFSNLGTNFLRGFFYCDQIPSAVTVTNVGITLNAHAVTNFTFESGQDGEVVAGNTPWRWALETPTNFAEANPAPPQTTVQITYLLSCSTTGTVALPLFSWAANISGTTNAFFGHSEITDAHTVKFLDRLENPLATGQFAPSGFTVWVDGVPGSIYQLAASTNLLNWVPLATNISPFSYVDLNSSTLSRRFYHAVPFTNLWAPLVLSSLPNGSLLLSVAGVQDCSYVVEASTNLLEWSPILTNVFPFSYSEADPHAFPMRFYRSRLTPPP